MTYLQPTPMKNPLLLPPLTLAYVGDSVYEVYVRQRLLARGVVRVNDLHTGAVRYVRAKAQATALAHLQTVLTEEEQDVARRGRNAKGHAAPKGSDAAEYAASSAFETLVGFLHMAGRTERLSELLLFTVTYLETD
jgi:ribonuclease-3 family protein